MAWEWVAPVATAAAGTSGVIFTWLAGYQGRKHAEFLLERQNRAAQQQKILEERKEAYLKLLRITGIEVRRFRYEREDREKFDLVSAKWPKADRAELDIEATNALGLFGSAAAVQLVADRRADKSISREERYRKFRADLIRLVRDEFQVDSLMDEDRDTSAPGGGAPADVRRPVTVRGDTNVKGTELPT